jgi:sortase A
VIQPVVLTPPRRRRRVAGRLARDLASVMILSGVLLLADAGVTLVWQEPVTAVIAMVQRGGINQQFLTAPLSPADRYALVHVSTRWERIAYLARREARAATTGAAIGRIVIPKLAVRSEVVQGTDGASLQNGPGHYPGTALPGVGETVAIAGHRTTYLAPFRRLDALEPGNRIILRMPYGRFTYVVQYRRIVPPTAMWVTRNVGYDRLVLSACNPLYSATQRIIVFARLDRVTSSPLVGP